MTHGVMRMQTQTKIEPDMLISLISRQAKISDETWRLRETVARLAIENAWLRFENQRLREERACLCSIAQRPDATVWQR